MSGIVSESDWIKGIGYSLLSSIIGGASKLAIRKSWLVEQKYYDELQQQPHVVSSSAAAAAYGTEAEYSGDFVLLRDTPPQSPFKYSCYKSNESNAKALVAAAASLTLPAGGVDPKDAATTPFASPTEGNPDAPPQIRRFRDKKASPRGKGSPARSWSSSSSCSSSSMQSFLEGEESKSPSLAFKDGCVPFPSPHRSPRRGSRSEGLLENDNQIEGQQQHHLHDVSEGISMTHYLTTNTSERGDNGFDRANIVSIDDQHHDHSCPHHLHYPHPNHHHHNLLPSRPWSHHRRLKWAYTLRGFGMVGMTVFNPLATVTAMNYASPSILAPFSGLTLVWIILFSPLVVGEKASPRQLLACSLILVGEVVVAMFGDHTNDAGRTVTDVVESYKQVPFLLFVAGLGIWMLFLSRWMILPRSVVSPTLKRFSWGAAGGSVTGLQNFLKDALTVLKATPVQNRHRLFAVSWLQWLPPSPPILFGVLFAGAIFAAFGGLLILTACMKRYDATYSSAMFVGSFVVSASIMSVIHYHTFSHLQQRRDLICYPAGLAVLMVGVYLLATAAPTHERVVVMMDRDEDEFASAAGGGGYTNRFDYVAATDMSVVSTSASSSPYRKASDADEEQNYVDNDGDNEEAVQEHAKISAQRKQSPTNLSLT